MTSRNSLFAGIVVCFVLAASLLSSSVEGFALAPSARHVNDAAFRRISMSAGDDDSPAGSFFNPVPQDDGTNPNDEEEEVVNQESPAPSPEATQSDDDADDTGDMDTFDLSVADLLRKRRAKPIASEPSTIGGVPTSKASGFGKTVVSETRIQTSSRSSFVQIGPPDNKRLNDVTNPERDDQGYTLYADERTGEKKRVFEALVQYPCEFTMKIVGANEGAFTAEIVNVVAESCEVDTQEIVFSERHNGKWTSITVKAPVKSAEMLYLIYENIDRDPRVKYKV
eukprot:CAMPEP_0198291000 /NCGR_PEP_ID=MMETSP1449-20131203/8669_1 /TAXON_ID=420275 /ORGANISM="Attheya septentrionalis, Strain CCMP2084" /LENGTH=281 /DNA_ID=CAMNT_0043989581 /DNA_START=224 /DNA_END=1069 /DNA_ORIENTATION=+